MGEKTSVLSIPSLESVGISMLSELDVLTFVYRHGSKSHHSQPNRTSYRVRKHGSWRRA